MESLSSDRAEQTSACQLCKLEVFKVFSKKTMFLFSLSQSAVDVFQSPNSLTKDSRQTP